MSPSLVLLQEMVERAENRKRIASRVVGEIKSYLSAPMRNISTAVEAAERSSLAGLLETLNVE